MPKYIVLFAFFLGMAVYVAVQDERATQQSAQKAEHLGSGVEASSDANHAKEHIRNSEGNTPSWFGFFRWPNGTTTWAIVLTLLAIAEQTRETRRAVIASLRPESIIRGIDLIPGEYIDIPGGAAPGIQKGYKPWLIKCQIANIGGSSARITEGNFTVDIIEKQSGNLPVFPPYDETRNWLKKQVINPGEHKVFDTPIDAKNAFRFRIVATKREGGAVGLSNLYCFGFIQYRDRVNVERRTAFCLNHNYSTDRFDRIDDPNYNYAD